ncbi:hypothetical protein GGI12_004522 [Dipsacomyces acuminosporus]|nr:hypothetical protein GGI12_004522 [Dipsacomyces acuminosporus]
MLSRLSIEQINSLEAADDVLTSPFICLSRIRDPLGVVGGYWNIDNDTVLKITSGSLDEAIEGLEAMRDYFREIRSSSAFSDQINSDIELLIARVDGWIRANRI